ncbi:hypothetical protein BDQ12DRAFT_619609 [Crucibulum laeve]|uniref:Uncharacterized protein n=1 Tax=Crucibulum laeve TaxID=68775 RepID=A0A5C3LEK4_9AGAR|nr:hypothetical protein BDQ12DRAFT_619609 [Crucibulum laeve]
MGLLLGAHLLADHKYYSSVTLAVNNQASLKAACSLYAHSGHTIIDAFINTLQCNILPNTTVTMRWVPGHMNIAGNEVVDAEAKGAITHGSSPATSLP